MEITSWKDLKGFANSLTDEQLKQQVFIYPEESGRIRVSSVSIEKEPFYYEVGQENEGCFQAAALSKAEFEEMEVVEAIPAGSILLDVEFTE